MKVMSISTSLTLLSLAVSTQLYAQTVEADAAAEAPSKNSVQLAPIVITATRSAQSIAEIAGTVQSIEQKKIEQQAAAGRKLADILAQYQDLAREALLWLRELAQVR